MARFIAGFAVGFSSVWQLTLVTLAVVPLMAAAGGTYAAIMIGLTGKSQKAYAEAGKIAEEVQLLQSICFHQSASLYYITDDYVGHALACFCVNEVRIKSTQEMT